ncbi:unnamed protein product [Cladocopium goreaui]|uniref:Uncharacterized protein n=1 Tax=Cladocopium goreaui TaxID=2562237 RepID=A0A9P1C0S0_9DINO|nr:unnamed protein product [Cladocopium goreaui]
MIERSKRQIQSLVCTTRRLAVHIQTAVYRTSFEFADHQLPQGNCKSEQNIGEL